MRKRKFGPQSSQWPRRWNLGQSLSKRQSWKVDFDYFISTMNRCRLRPHFYFWRFRTCIWNHDCVANDRTLEGGPKRKSRGPEENAGEAKRRARNRLKRAISVFSLCWDGSRQVKTGIDRCNPLLYIAVMTDTKLILLGSSGLPKGLLRVGCLITPTTPTNVLDGRKGKVIVILLW